MLPAWFIDEILRREREKSRKDEEVLVDRPPVYDPCSPDFEIDDGSTEERGVAIIDFTI